MDRKYQGREEVIGFAFSDIDDPRAFVDAALLVATTSAPSIMDKFSKARSTASGGGRGMDRDSRIDRRWSEGPVNAEISTAMLPYLLFPMFGRIPADTKSDQIGATKSYLHTLEYSNANTLQPLSISCFGRYPSKFPYQILDSITINLVQEGYSNFTANYKGLPSEYDGSLAVDYSKMDSSQKFIADDIKVRMAANEEEIVKADNDNFEAISMNLTINQKAMLEYITGRGDQQADDITVNDIEITGEIQGYYKNKTVRDLVFDNTYQTIELFASMGSGDTENGFSIRIIEGDLEAHDMEVDFSASTKQKITFRALMKNPEEYLKGTLTNQTENYGG